MNGQLLFWVQTVSILCYGTVFFHAGFLLLFSKKPGNLRTITAHLLLVFGVMCLMGAFSLFLELKDRLVDYLVFLPLVAIGPLADEFIFTSLQVVRASRRRYLALWAGFFLLSGVGGVLFASNLPVRFLYAGGYAWLLLVLITALVDLAAHLKKGWLESRPLRLFFATVVVNSGLVAAMGAVQLWGDLAWMFPLWIVTIFSLFGLVVLLGLKPKLFDSLASVVDQRLKYAKSRWETGAEEACLRLQRQMEDRSPYLHPDLKVADLAAELSMSPEQLSELINSRFSCNFNQYVNQYRVRHACQALVESSELSVLDICFASGFNSKSAFNQAFKAATGLTPREYRNQAPLRPSKLV